MNAVMLGLSLSVTLLTLAPLPASAAQTQQAPLVRLQNGSLPVTQQNCQVIEDPEPPFRLINPYGSALERSAPTSQSAAGAAYFPQGTIVKLVDEDFGRVPLLGTKYPKTLAPRVKVLSVPSLSSSRWCHRAIQANRIFKGQTRNSRLNRVHQSYGPHTARWQRQLTCECDLSGASRQPYDSISRCERPRCALSLRGFELLDSTLLPSRARCKRRAFSRIEAQKRTRAQFFLQILADLRSFETD